MKPYLVLVHGKPIKLSEVAGIGGAITVPNEVEAVYLERTPGQVRSGHCLYVGALLLRMLDSYFLSSGRYTRPHIPIPLGSLSTATGDQQDGVLYERVEGAMSFPWEMRELDDGIHHTKLKEWNEFVSAFREAGVGIDENTYDIDNPRISRRIIHKGLTEFPYSFRDKVLDSDTHWMRVGTLSEDIPVDRRTMLTFIDAEDIGLRTSPRTETYWLMRYGSDYLFSRLGMKSAQLQRLEELVKEARLWAINWHPNIRGGANYAVGQDDSLVRCLT